MAVKWMPDGYHAVTPYLVAEGAGKLIDFVRQTFDAKEVHPPMRRPDGTIMHAEMTISGSIVMMGEPRGDMRPMPAALYVYVADADAAYRRALAAGATSVMEPADQFYGDRSGGVKDPCGNVWWIATHREDVTPEEMKRRAEKLFTQTPAPEKRA